MLPLTAQQLFGAHLRHHRRQQGLSRRTLAARVGLPAQRLKALEAGHGVAALDVRRPACWQSFAA